MLPPETQHIIYDQIPRSMTIDWYEPVHGPDPDIQHTSTVDIRVREQRGDAEYSFEQYPLVAVTFDPTTVAWTPGVRLTDYSLRVENQSDPNVAYTEYVGETVYDQLNIVVAVADGIDVDDDGRTEIPKQVVAKELAREIYAAYLLGVDHLNDPEYMTGPKQWPVKIEETRGNGITRMPAGTETAQGIVRYAMQFNCRYEFTEERVVDATDAIDYELTFDTASGGDLSVTPGTAEFPADFGDPDAL